MLRFVLIMALFAVATYLIVRVLQDRGGEAGGKGRLPRPGPRRQPPRKIIAPDDDEDFLREIERKRRHKNPDESSD